MTNWSIVAIWHRSGAVVILLSCLLAPTWTSAATGTIPVSLEPAPAEHQIAAYHASPILPARRSSNRALEDPLQGHIAKARRVLLELQAFVEKAARTVELSDRLRRQRRENEKLKKSLANLKAARSAFEYHVTPMDRARSALTGTIVRNWLETVRLKYRSDDIDRDLLASEGPRLELESRVATLKRTLIERRTELLALRTQRAAIDLELGDTRNQVVEVHDDISRIERQRAEIAATINALHRQVTSTLRGVLLEIGARKPH